MCFPSGGVLAADRLTILKILLFAAGDSSFDIRKRAK
jgi:hypothetical protein